MVKYTPTIGLEIHAELKTKSKMFCSCLNDPYQADPNVNVCPVCMGHPGTLPVPNKEAIRMVVKVGIALNGNIAEKAKFDRKNYFYPDLPKGYQISQYDMPFVEKGYLEVGARQIDITRVHLEEDTARSQHPQGTDYSLVDFNRAGVPLMELVTEPNIQTAQEARQFAQELQVILKYLGVSDANMEIGQMRVEANISIKPEKAKELGTKVEVKNLNSFRAVERAIEFEIERQTKVLDSEEKVTQETRGWDESKGETFSQRKKEEAHDYRYFPEPDIPPFTFSSEQIAEIQGELPELPQARRVRFKEQYRLPNDDIEVFVMNKDLGEYFEQVVSELDVEASDKELPKRTKLAANYLVSDLLGLLHGKSVEGEDFHITAENFAELINLVSNDKVSTPAAKAILKVMYETGADPTHVMEDKGLAQVSGEAEIKAIARDVIGKNPKAVDDYKRGKEQALKFLVGQLMAQTKGAVNPQAAATILEFLLKT
ncbi:Asp-tRNA(Asn)/Glu-tRNA(Gln) amidotransferase subunit GatB [Patescibacteria group bacterium]|nr:Asp-tRNA(Asn)/Glu-tRNA(Gln) amidotransferase subunit GatB [Patescibacteria group bacterium]